MWVWDNVKWRPHETSAAAAEVETVLTWMESFQIFKNEKKTQTFYTHLIVSASFARVHTAHCAVAITFIFVT